MVSENLVWETVSKIFVSEKSLGFGFGKFGLGKKVSVSVSEKFGLGKKVSVSVSENLVSEKRSRYQFRSKFWYRHSVPAHRCIICMICSDSKKSK